MIYQPRVVRGRINACSLHLFPWLKLSSTVQHFVELNNILLANYPLPWAWSASAILSRTAILSFSGHDQTIKHCLSSIRNLQCLIVWLRHQTFIVFKTFCAWRKQKCFTSNVLWCGQTVKHFSRKFQTFDKLFDCLAIGPKRSMFKI